MVQVFKNRKQEEEAKEVVGVLADLDVNAGIKWLLAAMDAQVQGWMRLSCLVYEHEKVTLTLNYGNDGRLAEPPIVLTVPGQPDIYDGTAVGAIQQALMRRSVNPVPMMPPSRSDSQTESK